jgi:hypothetical protein
MRNLWVDPQIFLAQGSFAESFRLFVLIGFAMTPVQLSRKLSASALKRFLSARPRALTICRDIP